MNRKNAATSCFHCGQPVAGDLDLTVDVRGAAEPLCSGACRAVATAIVDGGLGNYYRYRSWPSAAPDASVTSYAAYDLPAVQENFVRRSDSESGGRSRVELLIEGITGRACGWLIEHYLGRLTGVAEVRVNVASQRCRLVWDSGRVALSTLLSALSAIGYGACPIGVDDRREAHTKERNRTVQRLVVAAAGVLAVGLSLAGVENAGARTDQLLGWLSLLVATGVLLFAARPCFSAAWRGLKAGRLVMEVPVSLAIGLGYLASLWGTIYGGDTYLGSVSAVVLLQLMARYLEMGVRHRNWLRMAGPPLPALATRINERGEARVPVQLLAAGDFVRVAPGELIPCDGIVLDAEGSAVESVLSGEPRPVRKLAGDAVNAGTRNGATGLLVEVSTGGGDTRLGSVRERVARASQECLKPLALADRAVAYAVGLVLAVAAAAALVWWQIAPHRTLGVTLSVLVVSCPWALSVAAPTAITAALEALCRRGLWVDRGQLLTSLWQVDRVLFAKTGTLTRGRLSVARVLCRGAASEQKILALAAALEQGVDHPIAAAFADCDGGLYATTADYRAGAGVSGTVDGVRYAIGRESYITELFGRTDEVPELPRSGEIWVMLASESTVLGWILLRDRLRPNARQAVASLQTSGVRVELLSGDRPAAVAATAAQLGIDHWQGGVPCEDKLAYLQRLQGAGRKVLVVGDGRRDQRLLAAAELPVAMVEATDRDSRLDGGSLLVSGRLTALAAALRVAARSRRVIRQNVGGVLGYHLLALPLAAAGLVSPWVAATGMYCCGLLVVINTLRLGRQRRGAHPGAAEGAGTDD